MLENFDIAAFWENLVDWCGGVFWTENTLYQIAIIAISFGIAVIVSHTSNKRLADAIEKANMPMQAKRVSNNLRRLILPITALTLIFFATQIASSTLFGMEVGLTTAITKLLLAWIVIRMALQFVQNKFARNFFAFSILAIAALSIFGVLDETSAALDSIGINLGESRLSLLAVFKSIFLLFFLLYMAIFVSTFAERKVLQAKGMKRSSQVLISKVIRITLIVFALLIGVTSAGIDLSLFAVFGGAVGLGVGFGLQKGISNLFSGMLLLLDKSIVPGDVLEMEGGTFGWVQHMGARYTEVVTRDNKSFLIPNEDFITQKVVNWSHGNTLIRVEVKFGVDYGHNPHEINAMAAKAAEKADERICEDPAPVCHLAEFADSSLNFKLRFWIKDAEKGMTNIRGAVMLALWDTFEENNIKIPYPHREVLITEQKKAS
ncbi:MAG: mechanosensitive ion channel protein [Micavibrio sp.]|nr:MAG: mechanosensitive ion channel protein [Micavibrio sp.]